MKIYFLRHEEREKNDVLFRSTLNEHGQRRANDSLKNYLGFLKPDEIYCSPFVRAMQTITPYMKEYRKTDTFNVEYGIAETIHHKLFANKFNQDFRHNENDYMMYPINRSYKSVFPPNNLKYYENEEKLRERVKVFARELVRDNFNTEKNILICSHRSTLNILINVLYNQTRDMEQELHMGKVTTFEDGRLLTLN